MTEVQIQFWLEQMEKLAGSYAILNDEVGLLYARVAVLESQIADLRWMGQLMVGLMITAVVGAVLNLVLHYKNYKNNKNSTS